MERPDEQRAENGLPKDVRDYFRRQIVADFAAALADADHFGVNGDDAVLQILHRFANRRIRKKSL